MDRIADDFEIRGWTGNLAQNEVLIVVGDELGDERRDELVGTVAGIVGRGARVRLLEAGAEFTVVKRYRKQQGSVNVLAEAG